MSHSHPHPWHELLKLWPTPQAMRRLVVNSQPAVDPSQLIEARQWIQQAINREPFASSDCLQAGLWLYVDELEKSHRCSQRNESDATYAYWHGIMHRREGDFSNSHYWFHQVGAHPVLKLIPNYDPHRLIDQVQQAHTQGKSSDSLITLQQLEWTTLFEWCLVGASGVE